MPWTIYKHTNKKNGKVYIGQTCQKLNDRWQDGKGYSRCKLFNNALKKYGWDGFEHEILEDNIETVEEANLKESSYIKLFNSYVKIKGAHGYNMTPGGDSTGENWESWEDEILINNYSDVGATKCLDLINKKWEEINPDYKRTEQAIYVRAMRIKIRKKSFWDAFKDKIILEYYPKEGRKCSSRIPGATRKMCEWRASILGIKWGVYWSEEDIRILKENYKFGIRKLIEVLPNKTKSQIKYQINHLSLKEHIAFVCFEKKIVFSSFKKAQEETGASASVISKCLRDKTRTMTSGGYHWCTKKDFENGWTPLEKEIINAKKVYCVQTEEIYDSITLAEKITGCTSISRCCLNHKYQCRDKNGNLLNWCFLEDKESFVFIKKKASWNAKEIICATTGEEFESMKDVLHKYPNIAKTTLFRALKDPNKYAGGLKWQYKRKAD